MNNCEKITRITELLSEANQICSDMKGHIAFNQYNRKVSLFIGNELFDCCLIEERREEHGRDDDKVIADVNGVEVFCLKPWEGRK